MAGFYAVIAVSPLESKVITVTVKVQKFISINNKVLPQLGKQNFDHDISCCDRVLNKNGVEMHFTNNNSFHLDLIVFVSSRKCLEKHVDSFLAVYDIHILYSDCSSSS